MSDFQVNSVATPPPIQAVRHADAPKPPKSQSDHKPLNEATSSRGPAVVLSGALAKPTDHKSGAQDGGQQGGGSQGGQQQASTNSGPGQHVNHVI